MAATYSSRNAYQSTRERLRALDTTAITFTKSRAPHAAASLAYYTFFSIFPLMLVFILAGSYFLDRQSMLQRVTQAVQGVLPISQQFIVQNLQQVLKQRTAVGIFVLVSLLWSASNMFNNLAYEINMAWPEARERNFVQSRLIGLDMIAGLTGLLVLSIVLDSLTKYLGGTGAPGLPFGNFNPWAIVSSLGSWIAVFLLYFAMYRWVPTVHVKWSASFWGALAASAGWKAATTGFAWYLASPFARYQLVYGSLGAIVAFLFLIYIIALVTLFGAHLTSAIDHLQKKTVAAKAPQGTAEKNAGSASSDQLASKAGRTASDTPQNNISGDKAAEAAPADTSQPGKESQTNTSEEVADPGKQTKYPTP
jgi:membrane protein